jgi:ParB-like chromosome segregation protein Spo0J
MKIRDRIKELRRVPAGQLLPNPRNWRTHPPKQQDALKAVLAEVGYADALLARETAEGGLMLIDGHLRAETTPDQEVPVLVLDVTESEAAKLPATLDPLAALAGTDAARLQDLLRDVDTENEALRQMLNRLTHDAGINPQNEELDPPLPNIETKYAIIVHCESEEQQLELLERFEQEGVECKALVL